MNLKKKEIFLQQKTECLKKCKLDKTASIALAVFAQWRRLSMQEDEIKFKVTIKYGRCDIRSWFIPKEGKLVGMGSKTCYDDKGVFESYSEEETGLVLSW